MEALEEALNEEDKAANEEEKADNEEEKEVNEDEQAVNEEEKAVNEEQSMEKQHLSTIRKQLRELHKERHSLSKKYQACLQNQEAMLRSLDNEKDNLLKDRQVCLNYRRQDESLEQHLHATVHDFDEMTRTKRQVVSQLQDVQKHTQKVDKEIDRCLKLLTIKGRRCQPAVAGHEEHGVRRQLLLSQKYNLALKELDELRRQAKELRQIRNTQVEELRKLTAGCEQIETEILETSEEGANIHHDILVARSTSAALRQDFQEATRSHNADMCTLDSKIKALKATAARRDLIHKTSTRLPDIQTKTGMISQTQQRPGESAALPANNFANLQYIKKAFAMERKQAAVVTTLKDAAKAPGRRTKPSQGPSPESVSVAVARWRHALKASRVSPGRRACRNGVDERVSPKQEPSYSALMSDQELKAIKESFGNLLMTNDSLQQLVLDRLSTTSKMRAEKERLDQLVKSAKQRKQTSGQGVGEDRDRQFAQEKLLLEVQKAVGKAEDTIANYASAVEGLLNKLNVPPAELNNLYGFQNGVHESNILDCLEFVEALLIRLELCERQQELNCLDNKQSVFRQPASVRSLSNDGISVNVPDLPEEHDSADTCEEIEKEKERELEEEEEEKETRSCY